MLKRKSIQWHVKWIPRVFSYSYKKYQRWKMHYSISMPKHRNIALFLLRTRAVSGRSLRILEICLYSPVLHVPMHKQDTAGDKYLDYGKYEVLLHIDWCIRVWVGVWVIVYCTISIETPTYRPHKVEIPLLCIRLSLKVLHFTEDGDAQSWPSSSGYRYVVCVFWMDQFTTKQDYSTLDAWLSRRVDADPLNVGLFTELFLRLVFDSRVGGW